MGSIKKTRKKFTPPSHPWRRLKLEEEGILKKEFGFANKKEIWKSEYVLKRFKRQAKKLIASSTNQTNLERKQLVSKLMKYGLANEDAKPENILNLNSHDIMNRRLQTLVYRNNLARSIKQARQFIVHGHIIVDSKKITSPSYLVLKNEEDKIAFDASSSLASPEHPERSTPEMKEAKEKKEDIKRQKRKPVNVKRKRR